MKKKWTNSEKANIALDAVMGKASISDIAAKNRVHPSLVYKWKNQLINNAYLAFSDSRSGSEDLVNRLYAQIGKLYSKNDDINI